MEASVENAGLKTMARFRCLRPYWRCLLNRVHGTSLLSMNTSPSLCSRLVALSIASLFSLAPADAGEASAFTDHGLMVPISEQRITLTTETAGKKQLITLLLESMARGTATGSGRVTLLVHDLASGQSQQYFPAMDHEEPEDVFSAFVSTKGKLYFNRCNLFDEFDLKKGDFTFSANVGGYAMSMAEGGDGSIYFATYPQSQLHRFDPASQQVEGLIRLDESEQYPTRMAIDQHGWLYVGIGTAQSNLVAYHPATGELRSLAQEGERVRNDSGYVISDEKGVVYGRVNKTLPWSRLEKGELHPAPDFNLEQIVRPSSSLYYGNHRFAFADGTAIEGYSTRERSFEVVSPDGARRGVKFEYETHGAAIGSLIRAVNGRIYGSTHHPMELWEYDPASRVPKMLGHLPEVGGGALTKFIEWEGQLVSNSYGRGDLFTFDPARPFDYSVAPGVNPLRLLRTEPVISRPHTLLLYPGSSLVVSAGWPGYGLVGGGMLIYDLAKREAVAFLKADTLLPGHSITTMAALPDGNLVFGTATLALSGGQSEADTAQIGLFDWKKRTISWHTGPLEESRYITTIATGRGGDLLYGITHERFFFSYDLKERRLLTSRKLPADLHSPASNRGDNALLRSDDGRLFLLMTRGIFEVDQSTHTLKALATPPVPIFEGGFISEGELFFASAGRLWSYKLPQP